MVGSSSEDLLQHRPDLWTGQDTSDHTPYYADEGTRDLLSLPPTFFTYSVHLLAVLSSLMTDDVSPMKSKPFLYHRIALPISVVIRPSPLAQSFRALSAFVGAPGGATGERAQAVDAFCLEPPPQEYPGGIFRP